MNVKNVEVVRADRRPMPVKDVMSVWRIRILRILYRAFWVFPIKKNRILFKSHQGQNYNCNPKYICEYFNRHYPGKYELVWVFQEPEKFRDIPGIVTVKCKSLKWLYYCATTKVFVTNFFTSVLTPKRKGQLVMETWHGYAYKQIGFSLKNDSAKAIWKRNKVVKNIDLFLTPTSQIDVGLEIGYHYHGEFLHSGLPRNDVQLNPARREAAYHKIRSQYHLKEYVVLYTPTFRKEGEGQNVKVIFPYEQFACVLEKRVGKSVSIMVHSHHFNGSSVKVKGAHIVDVSEYPDTQELFCAADMLITDYSSCMWDFALLKRPCLLYVPDLDEYRQEDRGFYSPIETWPGIVCKTPEELFREAARLDEDRCAAIAEKHLHDFGCCENGTASRQACERIEEFIKGKR